MKKPRHPGAALLLPITILLTPIPAFAKTCEAGFAPVIDGTPPLVKRGTGTARYLMFRVYDAALYTAPKGGSGAATGTAPLCLEICYHRALSTEVIVTAAEKVLHEQNDEATLARMAPQLESLHRAYKPVAEGDRYRLCRDPYQQLTLSLNDERLTTVSGALISQRYLDIWLGERPLSDSLREDLLAERE